MFIISAIVFILLFSFIVLIHEWGHYRSAIRNGVKVEEFGLGLPPKAKVLRENKNGTKFTINWIPFGGFVRMFGEDSQNEDDRKKKGSFASISILGRMEIVLAGVFMNFILAWVILTALFMIGTKPIMLSEDDFKKEVVNGNVIMEESKGITIASLSKEGLGTKYGFKAGDVIIGVNGENVKTIKRLLEVQVPNSKVDYKITRGLNNLNIIVQLDKTGKLGTQITTGPIFKEILDIKMGFLDSAIFSFKECFRVSVGTVEMFGVIISDIFTKQQTPDGVAGPIGIAQMTSSFVESGDFNGLFKFIALISLSLAVINVMPIPALDGGRFIFLLIEAIIRKPVPIKWETIIHITGYIFLMGLIAFVSYKDIMKFF